MAGRKKDDSPVKATSSRSRKSSQDVSQLDYVALVDQVRRSRSKAKSETAFEEIVIRMTPKMSQVARRFNIPGHSFPDVFQEALVALRFKAVKDYDQTRGSGEGPYPFDKFAILCIRRHLSTKLKSSYQNKKKVLNSCLSLDQDRNNSNDDQLFLADIIPKTEGTIMELLEQDEYFRGLFTRLIKKLSDFEKDVFFYYCSRNSYEQIAKLIHAKQTEEALDGNTLEDAVKSVDNALSRIKTKAKTIYKKYGDS
ncbi:MAG: hypothetical protein HC888_00175 [Candidatus Competibacteraceae bacterium]|nr:hypothetical protein [Candidatus Competibacteraceae bacterium]